METIGAGANARRARGLASVTRGGLRIAFLGYSDVKTPATIEGLPARPSVARETFTRCPRRCGLRTKLPL